MKKILKYMFSFSVLGIMLLLIILKSLDDNQLHVFILDIGQGDAILIQTPSREHVLVDGGPNDKVLQELPKVMPFYEKTLEAVILTHPHADHVNGLVDVLKRYEVKQVVLTGVNYNNPGYKAFLEQIAERQIPVIFAGSGNDYRLGTVVFDMMYPFSSVQSSHFENVNNSSVVFRLLYGKHAFYFSGDLEEEKELELVQNGLNLRADFIKAGHHGSKTSNVEPLLDKMKPRFAAISCGVNNQFGHPFYGTIQHLKDRKIKIFRTDLDGIIEATSDGTTLEVKKWGKELVFDSS